MESGWTHKSVVFALVEYSMELKQMLYVAINGITILFGIYVVVMLGRLFQTSGRTTLGASISSPNPFVVSIVALITLALSVLAVKNIVTIYSQSKQDSAGESVAS
jgi:hypothetical protein